MLTPLSEDIPSRIAGKTDELSYKPYDSIFMIKKSNKYTTTILKQPAYQTVGFFFY